MAECLGALLGRTVLFAEDAAGEDARAKAAALQPGAEAGFCDVLYAVVCIAQDHSLF